jgi:hypothetical protein
MEEVAAPHSIVRAGERPTCARQPGQRDAPRGRSSLAVRGLAAALAAAALIAPASAAAKPSLIAQAKTAMQRENAVEESHHEIPFKRGTKFTIACGVKGQDILCQEHAGPEQCVNGRPWVRLSGIFPIIGDRIGSSLTIALVQTDEYCH